MLNKIKTVLYFIFIAVGVYTYARHPDFILKDFIGFLIVFSALVYGIVIFIRRSRVVEEETEEEYDYEREENKKFIQAIAEVLNFLVWLGWGAIGLMYIILKIF